MRYGKCRLGAGLGLVTAMALTLPAGAMAAPPTPTSSTQCGGLNTLTKDPAPTADDPNLIDYRFYCNEDITAYTLIVNRRLSDFDTIDDFSPTADVFLPSGGPSTTQAVTCEAVVPGDGINCNGGAGGTVSAYNNIRGSFDLVEPYCKRLPAHAKPGTKAIPQAIVQLIVTNTTGAENGPFRLAISPNCPKVPDQVPAPKPKPKKKTRHAKKTRRHTQRR